ncbi:MAG: hypothetical protein C4530_07060 [Desulfobacteraceae bacterium]|nr:MAG: hypothetical protein C4530_07060 [Desulfobacteraceae bacterium]
MSLIRVQTAKMGAAAMDKAEMRSKSFGSTPVIVQVLSQDVIRTVGDRQNAIRKASVIWSRLESSNVISQKQ